MSGRASNTCHKIVLRKFQTFHVSGTTQTSFLAEFKATAINLTRKDTNTVLQKHYALCYIL